DLTPSVQPSPATAGLHRRFAMSKTKATAKAEEQEELKEHMAAAGDADQQAQTPEDTPAAPEGATTPGPEATTTPPTAETKQSKKAAQSVAARVLCAGTVGGQRFEAGVVIEGMPAGVAQAHAAMLDTNSAAVSHAVAAGAQVLAWTD